MVKNKILHNKNCNSKYKKRCNCDIWHTFDELYEHRMRLYITLCISLKKIGYDVWCSRNHSDGSKMYEDMFIMGIGGQKGYQITYHLDMKYWSEVSDEIRVLKCPPNFDKHDSNDVLTRLEDLFSNSDKYKL